MIATLLLLAAAPPLHFTVTYQTGEVRAGSDVAARVLCVSASGVDLSLMTDAQRQYREDVLRRVDSSWAGETWRGRLRLTLALSQADGVAPGAGVSQESCRFLFPDETVVRTDFVLSNPTGSQAVVVEDLESGQYLAVENVGKPSDLPELFKKLFQPAFDPNQKKRKRDEAEREELLRHIREEAERAAAKTRVVAEVNGQRDLLPEGATEADIGASLARMWDNLDGAPCKRIERILGVLAAVRATIRKASVPDTLVTGAVLPASALRFKGVPAIEAPSGTRVVRTSSFRDGVMNLQPPPEEVAKPFYGRRGWWVLDFSISFPSQVERLLRGDRP
jgi:cation transport regulator ChaB